MTNAEHAQVRRRGRRTLLALAALFLVPLGASFMLYYGATGLRPAASTAQGDLLQPARPLPKVALPTGAGDHTASDFLQGKWSWLYVGDAHCDERCRKALYLTRQSRIALNKDMDRVQRVFLLTGGTPDAGFLDAEHGDLVVARVDGPEGQVLLEALPRYDDIAPATAARIYLVDPHGNLVLSYSPNAPDKALLGDLRRLLRLSHIG